MNPHLSRFRSSDWKQSVQVVPISLVWRRPRSRERFAASSGELEKTLVCSTLVERIDGGKRYSPIFYETRYLFYHLQNPGTKLWWKCGRRYCMLILYSAWHHGLSEYYIGSLAAIYLTSCTRHLVALLTRLYDVILRFSVSEQNHDVLGAMSLSN